MKLTDWILIDTETNGLRKPIHALDVGAQLMHGWERKGEPFQMFINFSCIYSDKKYEFTYQIN